MATKVESQARAFVRGVRAKIAAGNYGNVYRGTARAMLSPDGWIILAQGDGSEKVEIASNVPSAIIGETVRAINQL